MSNTSGAARVVAVAVLAMVGGPVHVRADDYFSPTDERVRLSLGAMHVSSSTNIQADSSTGTPGTNINAESELGLGKSNFEPKFEVTVRVETRHRLSIDYFTLDRSGTHTVTDGPLNFGDVTFLTTDPLQTQLSLRTLGLTYEYSFWHSPTLEIAGLLGAHDTDISALAKVETPTRHIIQTEDLAGPVPTVGIDATWVASKRFYFEGRAQYLDLHVHNVTGSLGIYELDALYRYRPNVAVALGYTDFRARLASTLASQTSQGGIFSFATQGPEFFFRIGF